MARTRSWIAALGLLVAMSLVALMPLTASAAGPQPATFQIGGVPCSGDLMDVVEPVVRTTTGVCGVAGGSESFFCCEGGAAYNWTVNVVEMRGAVSGSWAISGNIDDVIWQGTLNGLVDSDGAHGVIRGTSNTGLSLHGTWTSGGPVDPTDINAATSIAATVTVRG